MLGANTGPDELIAKVDRVGYRCCEHNSFAAIGQAVPMRDDVANQFCSVHSIREFALGIISLSDGHALQVWLGRGKHLGSDQVAKVDQLLNLRALNQSVEDIPQATTIPSTWRCSHADDARVGVAVDDRSVCPRANVVGLVNEHDVGRRKVGAAPDASRPEGLHRRHLDALHRAHRFTSEDQARTHTGIGKLASGLVDQLASVGEKQHMLILRAPDYFGCDHRLAGARWRNDERTLVLIDFLDCLQLVRAQLSAQCSLHLLACRQAHCRRAGRF